jgi:hypothetical protein
MRGRAGEELVLRCDVRYEIVLVMRRRRRRRRRRKEGRGEGGER